MSQIFSYYGPPFRVPPHTTIYWGPHRAATEESIPPGFSTDESAVMSRMYRDGVAGMLMVITTGQQPEDGALVVTMRNDAKDAHVDPNDDNSPTLGVEIGAGLWGGSRQETEVSIQYGIGNYMAIAFTNNSESWSAPVIQFGLCYA